MEAIEGGAFASRVSASFAAASGTRALHPLLAAFDAKAQAALLRALTGGGAPSRRRMLALRRRVHWAAEWAAHLDAPAKAAHVTRAYRAAWEHRALGMDLAGAGAHLVVHPEAAAPE